MSAGVVAHAAEFGFQTPQMGRLDHVFLIIMENETNTDIIGNPNAPFINSYAATVNQVF